MGNSIYSIPIELFLKFLIIAMGLQSIPCSNSPRPSRPAAHLQRRGAELQDASRSSIYSLSKAILHLDNPRSVILRLKIYQSDRQS